MKGAQAYACFWSVDLPLNFYHNHQQKLILFYFYFSTRIDLWLVNLHIIWLTWKYVRTLVKVARHGGHFSIQMQFYQINILSGGAIGRKYIQINVYCTSTCTWHVYCGRIKRPWTVLSSHLHFRIEFSGGKNGKTQRNERDLNYSILIKNHAMHIFLPISRDAL